MITVNVSKAKDIAHDIRRAARSKEFAPLDVQATIPMFAQEAEAKRQVIRDYYAQVQSDIDVATSVDELKLTVEEIKSRQA